MTTITKMLNAGNASRISTLTTPTVHFVLRVATGLLFMQHGAQKLFGLFGGVDGNGATAEFVSLFGVAGVLEFFGGLLIAVGLLTRPTAFVLAGQMMVAYFMVHAPQGGFPIQNGGELALIYATLFIFIASAGPGGWSLERMLAGKETATKRRQGDRSVGSAHRSQGSDRPAAERHPTQETERTNKTQKREVTK